MTGPGDSDDRYTNHALQAMSWCFNLGMLELPDGLTADEVRLNLERIRIAREWLDKAEAALTARAKADAA